MTAEHENGAHPVRKLLDRMESIRYPPGVIKTWELVDGPEFFPGGCGLWTAQRGKQWPEFPNGGVIVLGHNLDSLESYRRNLATGGIMRGPTWSNLGRLLGAANVAYKDVFLTNFFMGVGPEQLGEFAGASDAGFVDECLELLRFTIRLLRPRAMLVLGGHTRRHLIRLSPHLAPWAEVQTFAELDRRGLAVIVNVSVSDRSTLNVANLVHPSGATMGGNQARRTYHGLTGFSAEVAMAAQTSGADPATIGDAGSIPSRQNSAYRSTAGRSVEPAKAGRTPSQRKETKLQRMGGAWRINTDRNVRTDCRTCDLWYELGMALAGDFIGEELRHAVVFRKLSVGDGVFMHHSGLGVVGFGIVLETWDKQVYEGDRRLLYVKEQYEYRVRVRWDPKYDARDTPLRIHKRLPHMGTYSEVDPTKWDIDEVLEELSSASSG